MKNNLKKAISIILSIICFFIIWALLANKLNSQLILPKVSEVFSKILYFSFKAPSFWKHFAFSFMRIMLSFVISVFAGTLLALLAGEFQFFNYFCKFPLSLLRTLPVISVILIALFWLKSNSVPIFVSILMTFPLMFSSLTGMKTVFLSLARIPSEE